MMVTGVFANKPWDAKTFETWQLGSNSNANAANQIPYVISHFTRHFILIGLYLGICLLRCKYVPFLKMAVCIMFEMGYRQKPFDEISLANSNNSSTTSMV